MAEVIMPANLTPQYLAAEQRFKEAVTPQDKVAALEEMMAVLPKHKGTEKLQADLRRRLAKLRAEAVKKHGASKASAIYSVQKEGAGQIVLVGAPNVGKSSLLARLTHAVPEIGDYPFTTRLPQPGMMPFENIYIQLVDMPPIDETSYEPWMGSLVRQADLSLLVVDLGSDDLLEGVEAVLRVLQGSKIRLEGKMTRGAQPGQEGGLPHRALILANKLDAGNASENLEILREFFESRFEILAVSALRGDGLDSLSEHIFKVLDVVRIHTKIPGKKVDMGSPPFVLKHGSTVLDAARAVHRDFVHSLRFARVWSPEKSRRTVKFDGQMVERTHVLEDGEILELHLA
jgi:ribosome-interacting GTPase 1